MRFLKSVLTFCTPFFICLWICMLPKHVKQALHSLGPLHHPAHILLFFLLTRWLYSRMCFGWLPLLATLLTCSFGTAIELTQQMMHGGRLEYLDITDDCIGSLVAFLIVLVTYESKQFSDSNLDVINGRPTDGPVIRESICSLGPDVSP